MTKIPRIQDTFLNADTYCVTCGREIDTGARVRIVDPYGHSNVACSDDCADEEAYALADLNPDTDWR